MQVDVRHTPYVVVGSSAGQLHTVLWALGPLRGGRRFVAFTDWEVVWRYRAAEDSAGWRIGGVTVLVSIQVTVPRWRPPRSASGELIASWQRVLAAIDLHEQGHIDLAVEAGRAIHGRLLELPAASSTGALHEAAFAAAESILRGVREREVAYDRDTCHGALQGVCFPETRRENERACDAPR